MVFWQLTIDANAPGRLAEFWALALGYQPVPPDGPHPWHRRYRRRLGGEAAFDNRLFDPDGLRPPLWFQRVPEGSPPNQEPVSSPRWRRGPRG